MWEIYFLSYWIESNSGPVVVVALSGRTSNTARRLDRPGDLSCLHRRVEYRGGYEIGGERSSSDEDGVSLSWYDNCGEYRPCDRDNLVLTGYCHHSWYDNLGEACGSHHSIAKHDACADLRPGDSLGVLVVYLDGTDGGLHWLSELCIGDKLGLDIATEHCGEECRENGTYDRWDHRTSLTALCHCLLNEVCADNCLRLEYGLTWLIDSWKNCTDERTNDSSGLTR